MPDNDAVKKFDLARGLFGPTRQLTLYPDRLAFDGTVIAKDTVVDVIYESDWISWYRFSIGQWFRISLKTDDGGIIRIQFSNYFGLHNRYGRYYSEITGYIGTFYLLDLVAGRVKQVLDGASLDAMDVKITSAGIRHTTFSWLMQWQNVCVHEYYNYFAIYDNAAPETNVRIRFDQWQAEILIHVVRALKEKLSASLTTD